jgi:hypothetical protein
VVLAAQSANAQKRYPSIDDRWDATDYIAMVQRVEDDGLALPTLSATKPVFERMVNLDNIPLHMGLNPKLSITIRFQRLDDVVQPLHKLVILYSNEMKKGKPYATELTRLMIYQSKISAALLDISDPYRATIPKDQKYQMASLNQRISDARQIYSELVHSTTETRLYSKSDVLEMIRGALNELRSYQPILTNQDRLDLTKTLTQQISKTTDQQLKTALTELHDAIEHHRIRT